MASPFPPESLSEGSDISASDTESEAEAPVQEPCRYYNSGHCRDGNACRYRHVCKYALRGNCKYGSRCKLNHPEARGGRGGGGERGGGASPTDPKLTDGRLFQWQLNNGSGWEDVENDHVIEAQFCLPHSKGIKIYNTEHGAVCIDFCRLRVRGKQLGVRRLDDGQSEWAWYCIVSGKWTKYGDKDANGKQTPVQSSDIEQTFQRNPSGSFTFNIGSNAIEIKFKKMQQEGSGRKRNVVRRPLFRHTGASQGANGPQNALWQFRGDKGGWQNFKDVNDIEKAYQQYPTGTVVYTVNNNSYELDFGAMIQTNRKTKNTRKIRRN